MEPEDEFPDDIELDDDEMYVTEDVMADMIQKGELLASCVHCGTFLTPQEALSVCPHCQTEVWSDGIVVRLTSQLPQC